MVKGGCMKKRYLIIPVVIIAIIFFVINLLFSVNSQTYTYKNTDIPRIGQKLWTYNMNKYEWRNYSERDDDFSKEEIVLQYQGPELGNGFSSYKLLTGNFQVPREDVWIGEGSQEFIKDKKLYSYYPKTFEYYEVVFNGVKFVPKKVSIEDLSKLFKDYKLIKLSEIYNGSLNLEYSKSDNKYIIINDGDSDFYKYYIVPNDSKKLEIGKYSNQFKVTDRVQIRLQRLEGCSISYPCYEINII